MIIEEIKNIKSSRRDLRNFGLVVGSAVIVFGIALLWRGREYWLWPAGIGAALAFLGLVSPQVLKPLQKAWMFLAVILGWLATNAMLIIFFYLILAPLGFFMRLSGKKLLSLKFRDPGLASYWKYRENRKTEPKELEKQF